MAYLLLEVLLRHLSKHAVVVLLVLLVDQAIVEHTQALMVEQFMRVNRFTDVLRVALKDTLHHLVLCERAFVNAKVRVSILRNREDSVQRRRVCCARQPPRVRSYWPNWHSMCCIRKTEERGGS